MSVEVEIERRGVRNRLLRRGAALAGLAALVIGAVAALSGAGDSYRVSAVFEDVRGLIPGGEVKAGSAIVGQVSSIDINEQGYPVVVMEIDDDFRLLQGAFADIRLASNVGGVNRFVDLEQGSGPPLAEDTLLGPSQTDHPVDLDMAVSNLDPGTREEIAVILAGVDAALRGRGDDLADGLRHATTALGETADLLAEINADREALRTILEQGSVVVGALGEDPDSLGGLATELAGLLEVTASRQEELGRVARALGPGLASGRIAVERLAYAIPSLTALTEASEPVVAELLPTAEAVGPAIEALRPLIAEARSVIDASPAQLAAISPALDAALPLVRQLKPIQEGLGPLVDYLRTWAPEAIGFFTLGSDATSNFDLAGHMIRSTAIPIQVARHTNIIGPEDDGAGLVERPFARTPGSLAGDPWMNYPDSFIAGAQPPGSFITSDEEWPP